MSRPNRFIRPAATAALSLLTALAAHAAPPHLRLAPTLGNALIPGGWQDMTVQVDNPAGGAPIDGAVTLDMRDLRYPTRFDASYSAPIQVPAGGSATVRIPVRVLNRALPNVTVTLRSGAGDRAQNLARKEFDVRMQVSTGLFALAVTAIGAPDRPDPLTGLRLGVRRANFRFQRASDEARPAQTPVAPDPRAKPISSPVIPIPIAAADLPTEIVAYDTIGIVALDHGVTLTDAQSAALRAFVQRGGLLIDPDGGFWSDGAGRVISRSDPAELRRALREMAGTAPVRDELEGWDEDPSNVYFPPLQQSLMRAQGLEAPPFETLLFFLAGYLILAVPIQYTVLRRIDRRELAWVVTPALAVGFSIAAYSFARAGRPTSVFSNAASVLETVSGSKTATQVGALGIYAPASDRYRVSVALPQTVLWHQGTGETAFTARSQPESATAEDLTIPQWSVQPIRFRSEAAPVGDGVQLNLRYENGRLVGDIQNHTGQALRSVELRFGQVSLPLGDLYHGQTRAIDQPMPLPTENLQDSFAGNFEGSNDNTSPGALGAGELWRLTNHVMAQPTLIGRWDGGAVPVAVNGAPVPQRSGASVLVVHGNLVR